MRETINKDSNNSQTALIPGRKLAYEHLGNVVVLGLGVSGKAVAEYLAKKCSSRISSLTILGGKSNDDVLAWAQNLADSTKSGFTNILFDEDDASKALPETASEFDLCVASPGISAFSAMYENASANSKEIISEIEFAWRESISSSRWAAITGTNGKTTTTALLAHILQTAGLDAHAVGNIGDTCIGQVASDIEWEAGDSASEPVYVVETSSYQLASTSSFAPNVAIILGITPDHIKWHKTHEHYVASKFKLLDNLSSVEGALAVLDATNDEVRKKVKEIKSYSLSSRGYEYIPLGTKKGIGFDMRKACGSDNSAFVDDSGCLTVAFEGNTYKLCSSSELKILGRHNQVNALAAAAAALGLQASLEDVISGLKTFLPLEHRIEPVGTFNGVSYYNDSKATNVDATLVALETFLPAKPIIMLGGDDKGTDLSPLFASCRANAKACICYGEAGRRFYDALSALQADGIQVILGSTFKDAFEKASSIASDGDIVLLSPACASFDEFTCFEQRGERFKEYVKELGR